MSKEIIRFKGLTLDRDEQSAQHGELALCGGVELHDGALRPSVLQGSKVQHDAGGGTMVNSDFKVGGNVVKLLYVHDMPSYRHFIGVYNNGLYWFNEDGTPGNSGTVIHTFTSDTIISINSVGNTLVVLATTGVHYILWKDTNYKYLGTEFPFVEIQFRPDAGHLANYDNSTIVTTSTDTETDAAWRKEEYEFNDVFYPLDTNHHSVGIKSDRQAGITDAVQAIINQTNNTVASDGHFYAPFFIRYCYRLYDGSMVMHSAPLFMNVAMPYTTKVYAMNLLADMSGTLWPVFGLDLTEGSDTYTIEKTVLYYRPSNVGIDYKIDSLNGIQDWSDIIKSVDIFVSPQLPREDFTQKIKKVKKDGNQYGVRATTLKVLKQTFNTVNSISYDEDERALIGWNLPSSVSGPLYVGAVFDVPMQSDDTYLDRIRNTSNFYKIKSIDIENLETTGGSFVTLDYNKSVVASIATGEAMKDDYLTHNALLPAEGHESGMSVYNHRLNLYGMEERLFAGFTPKMMINEATPLAGTTSFSDVAIIGIVVALNTSEGKKYVLVSSGSYAFVTSEFLLSYSVLFYPDTRAYRMIVYVDDNGTTKAFDLKMEPHNFLNGAITTELFYQASHHTLTPVIISETFPWTDPMHNIVLIPNKVITSEVDNPFYFPAEGRNTIGTGSIIGIAAVTRALSQGQVGDHDLVVFATDGIWVMKVASTGTYSAIHNISREVCSNPKSICQLDQSIVFATERRLARFVESDVASMSDMLDGPILDLVSMLPGLSDAFSATGTPTQQLIRRLLDFNTPAVELFNNGSAFYDYASLRVVVLPAANASGVVTGGVAMVFSIRDQAWSTMPIPDILSVVPGYPSPFVQTDDGTVMILNKPYDYSTTAAVEPGIVITRELTFSDTMDVIRGYRQYSDLNENDVASGASPRRPKLYLFGSNDQRTWRQIGYSDRWFYNYMPGTPFRFFRIALFVQMKPSEEYQQLELEVVNKYAKL